MSNRLAAAYADAWLSADFAASKRALKDEIFLYEQEYKALTDEIKEAQEGEIEDRSLYGLVGNFLGGIGGFIFGGGPSGAVIGWEAGGEAAEWIFDEDIGDLRTGDDRLDALAAELDKLNLELSSKATKYGILEGREKEAEIRDIKDETLESYESWSDQFYQDSWGHLTDLAMIYATSEVGKQFGQGLYDKYLGGTKPTIKTTTVGYDNVWDMT